MSTPTLKRKVIHSGTHEGFPFEIHERPGLEEGDTIWTFYVFIHEKNVKDFEGLWLTPRIDNEKWLVFDYFKTWVAGCDGWNGAVTYYRKHGELPGFRCVEFGCDFSHLWDHDREYCLADIHSECILTINAIVEHEKESA